MPIREFNESITHWSSSFVTDQFDVGHSGDLVELSGDVLLVHPWLNVADPESLGLRVVITRASSFMMVVVAARRLLMRIHSVHFL